jgi:hypothetical protein
VAAKARIQVHGTVALGRAINRACGELRDLSDTNREVAGAIVRAARPPRRTGRLAGSLYAAAGPDYAVAASDLVYAGVIHGGWRAHGIEPQPFLSDAADRVEPRVLDLYTDRLDDILHDVATMATGVGP